MSSSRKSSASSTRSVSSATKPKIPHHLPKLDSSKLNEDKKKISYLNDVTENDIKDDKAKQRCKLMMQQLNELSEAKNQIKEKKISNGKLSPLIPSTSKGKKLNLVGTKVSENDQNHVIARNNRLSPLRTNDSDSESDDSGSDEDFRKNLKAPNELLEEFLVYIMEKKWQDAHKLCKFILMYEPNHPTAKEFLPLIESKLNESSDDEDESSGEDDEYDDDDDDDDEDDDDDDDDEDEEEDDSGEDTDSGDENDIEEIDSGNDQNIENDLNNFISKSGKTDDDDADVLIQKIHK